MEGTVKGHDVFKHSDIVSAIIHYGLFQGENCENIEQIKRVVCEKTKDAIIKKQYPDKPRLITELSCPAILGGHGDNLMSEELKVPS